MVVHCCVYIQYTVYFISFLCCVQLITNIVSFANPITCHLKSLLHISKCYAPLYTAPQHSEAVNKDTDNPTHLYIMIKSFIFFKCQHVQI